jgi:hypothetical protein
VLHSLDSGWVVDAQIASVGEYEAHGLENDNTIEFDPFIKNQPTSRHQL